MRKLPFFILGTAILSGTGMAQDFHPTLPPPMSNVSPGMSTKSQVQPSIDVLTIMAGIRRALPAGSTVSHQSISNEGEKSVIKGLHITRPDGVIVDVGEVGVIPLDPTTVSLEMTAVKASGMGRVVALKELSFSRIRLGLDKDWVEVLDDTRLKSSGFQLSTSPQEGNISLTADTFQGHLKQGRLWDSRFEAVVLSTGDKQVSIDKIDFGGLDFAGFGEDQASREAWNARMGGVTHLAINTLSIQSGLDQLRAEGLTFKTSGDGLSPSPAGDWTSAFIRFAPLQSLPQIAAFGYKTLDFSNVSLQWNMTEGSANARLGFHLKEAFQMKADVNLIKNSSHPSLKMTSGTIQFLDDGVFSRVAQTQNTDRTSLAAQARDVVGMMLVRSLVVDQASLPTRIYDLVAGKISTLELNVLSEPTNTIPPSPDRIRIIPKN